MSSEAHRAWVLGTRGSALALWQARRVKTMLEAAGHAVRLQEITTTGDRHRDTLISEIGDEAVFTKELDRALLAGEIQLAVHSLKDLPSRLPEGIALAAVSVRASAFDAFVAHPSFGGGLDDLPEGAVLATGSLRRRAQLKAWRPDLRMTSVRGNVDTRLEKLAASDWHGLILAVAGLERMGLAEHIREAISPEIMVPAVGQGALGIACAAGDEGLTWRLRAALHDEAAGTAAAAERAFMQRIDGGCQVPTGAWARYDEDASGKDASGKDASGKDASGKGASGKDASGSESLLIDGCIASLDGRRLLRERRTFTADEAEATGRAIAEVLLDRGGREVLDEIRL